MGKIRKFLGRIRIIKEKIMRRNRRNKEGTKKVNELNKAKILAEKIIKEKEKKELPIAIIMSRGLEEIEKDSEKGEAIFEILKIGDTELSKIALRIIRDWDKKRWREIYQIKSPDIFYDKVEELKKMYEKEESWENKGMIMAILVKMGKAMEMKDVILRDIQNYEKEERGDIYFWISKDKNIKEEEKRNYLSELKEKEKDKDLLVSLRLHIYL